MPGKRKRTRPSHEGSQKKIRPSGGAEYHRGNDRAATISHPLISLYYPSVFTLRDYLLLKLPPTSKTRQRRIATLGILSPNLAVEGGHNNGQHDEKSLANLLDSTLVGVPTDSTIDTEVLLKERDAFTQYLSESGIGSGGGALSQPEIVDLAIQCLFNRKYKNEQKPRHILCHGYQRSSMPRQNMGHNSGAGIRGIASYFPNIHVDTVKSSQWAAILRVLGKEGEKVMFELLVGCGLFVAVSSGQGNFYQLSGTPLIDMIPGEKPRQLCDSTASAPTCQAAGRLIAGNAKSKAKSSDRRGPGSITFVRNRMLYARAALNAKGEVRYGLRHIHVLNRFPDYENKEHTIHIMKYIFPREFGLHNVFDSVVNSKETVQPFQDYTMREQESRGCKHTKASENRGDLDDRRASKDVIPKRLRGKTLEIVSRFQKRHSKCPYAELLKYYCGGNGQNGTDIHMEDCSRDESTLLATQKSVSQCETAILCSNQPQTNLREGEPVQQRQSFADLATPPVKVSAFCRSALSHIIPDEFWGFGEDGDWNKQSVMRNVDRFIKLRKFESLSLHEVLQGLKITSIPWLTPPHHNPQVKISNSDFHKRQRIFSEFVYYVFDSLLIPLIRSNFHVTETCVHRNRLFFFQHDVWRSLSEPALTSLKLSMFDEVKVEVARQILDRRSLGFSQVRILPKETGVRPIVNLRRKPMIKKNGRVILGRSINTVMAPVFNVLGYEKSVQPEKLGSALFSVGDMYLKLKPFKAKLEQGDQGDSRLYFAKVDVQSCFDNIPQRALVELMEKLTTQDEYRVERHVEIKPPDSHAYAANDVAPGRPSRKFRAVAKATNDYSTFQQTVEGKWARGKKNTVFVDQVFRTFQDKETLLELLGEHIQRNLVKIGKKFYRQKAGIPQGSILSSLLCNFFYADLEVAVLGFLNNEESILLRLIDDFLLVTLNVNHAKRFLQVMHDGRPEYGVSVNAAKSLVNFEAVINGKTVPRLVGTNRFPYCGTLVDTRTLDICKERRRPKDGAVSDSLTVEFSRVPGRMFHRKALNAFKIQMHAMFLDTNFNSIPTVLTNIYQSFVECAIKFYSYLKSLSSKKQPRSTLLIKTIKDLIELAFVLLKSKNKNEKSEDYRCAVTKSQVNWLASTAFCSVLSRKQSKYREVLTWLDQSIDGTSREPTKLLRRVVKTGSKAFRDFRY